MWCMRWLLPLVVLPYPTTSPFFLLVFILSLFLHARPCFYCVVLMLFLFRASCFWEAVPIDTPLIKHLPFSAFSATYAPISSRTRITTYADAIRENLTHALTTDAGVRPDHAAAVAAALQLPALVQPADWCWCDLGLGVGLGVEFFGSRAQDEGREQSAEGEGRADGRSAKPKASSALTRLFEPRDVSAWEMETVRRAQRALVARVKHATEAERVRREREEQQQREREREEREEKEREREKEAEGEAVAGTGGTSHSHAYAQGDEEELTHNGDPPPPPQQQQQRGKRRQELFYRLRRLVKPDTSSTASTAVPTASTALPSPFSTSSSIDSSSPSSPSPPLAASSPPPAPAPPPPSPPAPTVNSTFASEPSTPPRKWFYDLRAYGLDITVDFNWSRR